MYQDVAASFDDEEECSDCERAFEIADTLEQGLACEVVTDFMHPLRRSSKLWRFQVRRSDDRLRYRLYTDEGDFLMFAQAFPELRKVHFFLYNPDDKEASTLLDLNRPAFSMTWNDNRTEWRLVQEKCEHCQFSPRHLSCCASCGKQQVAFIRHGRHNIGDGVFNNMELIVPGLHSDESRVIWCPRLGRGDLAVEPQEPFESQELVTRAPAWNDEVESLVLDFKGRKVQSSAKNFQLSLGQRPEHVICQYGKIAPHTFSLDFRYPLSCIQAFGTSITTMFWT
jgi:hypothetical protein